MTGSYGLAEFRRALADYDGVDQAALRANLCAFLDRVTPVADEDLERETEEKTSSVHFMRFELTADMAEAVKSGAAISIGIDHPAYTHAAEPIPQNIRDSLADDLS